MFEKYTPEQLTAYSTFVLAIVTFFAVIVALFQEKIKDKLNKAKIKAEIILSPPHCHLISLGNSSGFVSNSIYIRILVSNINNKLADNVEVMIVNFWDIDGDGNRKIRKSFLPMNLKWSHFECVDIKIPGNLFRHCDLGPIRPLNNKNHLVLDTITQPNPVANMDIPNVIPPGKYQFELLISGDNTNTIKKTWEIEFDGNWIDNEDEMLTNHIFVNEVK